MQRVEEAVTKLSAFLDANAQSAAADNVETTLSLFSAAPQSVNKGIDLDIAFLVAPRPHRVPLYFTLPHEVHTGSICVVTKPPQRTYKDIVLKAQEDGEGEALKTAERVKKVIDATKLKAKFSDPVTMRALANSFDNFFLYKVDKFPEQLSGEFLGRHAHPVWMPKGSFLNSLSAAIKTAVVPRRGYDNVTVRVGHTGLSPAQIAENVESLMKQLTESRDGVTYDSILQVRVAGTAATGKRAALPVFAHNYDVSHPNVLLAPAPVATTPMKKSADASTDEPSSKRRRK